MATNPHLLRRVTAAAYELRISDAGAWAQSAMWPLAATAGWADSWAYAAGQEGADVEELGRDGGVITDQMILDAVNDMRAEAT